MIIKSGNQICKVKYPIGNFNWLLEISAFYEVNFRYKACTKLCVTYHEIR